MMGEHVRGVSDVYTFQEILGLPVRCLIFTRLPIMFRSTISDQTWWREEKNIGEPVASTVESWPQSKYDISNLTHREDIFPVTDRTVPVRIHSKTEKYYQRKSWFHISVSCGGRLWPTSWTKRHRGLATSEIRNSLHDSNYHKHEATLWWIFHLCSDHKWKIGQIKKLLVSLTSHYRKLTAPQRCGEARDGLWSFCTRNNRPCCVKAFLMCLLEPGYCLIWWWDVSNITKRSIWVSMIPTVYSCDQNGLPTKSHTTD